MSKTNLRFKIVDAILIAMMILPIVFGIILNVLTKPASEGISITGARVFFTLEMPIQSFPVTESQINSALVMITLLFFCFYMTHGLSEHIKLKRQHFAEIIVEKVDSLVNENMGEYFMGFSPFIIAIMALSALSSLLSLCGLYPPTSDINIVGGWAVLVFIIITYYKMKCGPVNYLKIFAEPVALLAPINFISEFATPISMAFRHYGNVLSGTVISVLLGSALGGLSSMLLSSLPGFLADIPIFQIGIPAVLSVIFAMLTMMYVSGAFDIDTYKARKAKKLSKTK